MSELPFFLSLDGNLASRIRPVRHSVRPVIDPGRRTLANIVGLSGQCGQLMSLIPHNSANMRDHYRIRMKLGQRDLRVTCHTIWLYRGR